MAQRVPRIPDPHERLFDLFVSLHRQHAPGRTVDRPTLSDARALLDILDVQCFGEYARAEETVRELFTAADGQLRGTSISKRWAALVHWYEAGKPVMSEQVARRGA